MRQPKIELLWWDGCPSTERALAELREALRDVGLAPEVSIREITTDQQAHAEDFMGSPTVLIDGPVGLSCRVYRRRDGGISPTPDPDDLHEALRRAAEREEVRR